MTRKIVIHNCGECPFVDERYSVALCTKKNNEVIVEFPGSFTEPIKKPINLEEYAIPSWCMLDRDEH